MAYQNAVLDDEQLQHGLRSINPKYGDLISRVGGEVWGLPLIDQKTKALIALAVDVVNQAHVGAGNPFVATSRWPSNRAQPAQNSRNCCCSYACTQGSTKPWSAFRC